MYDSLHVELSGDEVGPLGKKISGSWPLGKDLVLLATEPPLAHMADVGQLYVGGLVPCQMFLASEAFTAVACMPSCRVRG